MAEFDDIQHIKQSLSKLTEAQANMASKIDGIGEEVSDISLNLSKVSQTVIGDVKYGQKGLVAEVNELKDYVAADKQRNAKIVGGLTVIGVIWTFIMKLIFYK